MRGPEARRYEGVGEETEWLSVEKTRELSCLHIHDSLKCKSQS